MKPQEPIITLSMHLLLFKMRKQFSEATAHLVTDIMRKQFSEAIAHQVTDSAIKPQASKSIPDPVVEQEWGDGNGY